MLRVNIECNRTKRVDEQVASDVQKRDGYQGDASQGAAPLLTWSQTWLLSLKWQDRYVDGK